MQCMPTGPRARVAVVAAVLSLASFAALAQAEISGQVAATGSPVPKDIAVPQARLDAAGGDAANFLHSNGSYAQTRY